MKARHKSVFKHVALVGKYNALGASAVLQDIAQFLHSRGCEVSLEAETAGNSSLPEYSVLTVPQIGEQCDLALVVGGDGTMLGIGRRLAPYGVPLIGVNQGRLGFITDIAYGSYQKPLANMLDGEFDEDHRSMMQGSVWRDGREVFNALAMNDVVVNRGASAGMVELRVEVNGHFVANQRADGLIIASPTGSTAYALSGGGPLLHPSIPGWVLVPIAPHNLSNRPIVLPDAAEVAIELVAGRDASANFDMQSLASMLIGDRVVVQRSKYQVRFLHPKGWSYFDTLREKLHWNEGLA
jgi:NAD+ kinase